MNNLSKEEIRKSISELERIKKCYLKTIDKRNQIIVKCTQKDCLFKLKFQLEYQNYR
jgi:hypothetical protein